MYRPLSVSQNKDIPSVTMLRGIACLGVCLMHFTGTTDSKLLIEIGKFGGYGVPIFFAISGFIIPYTLFHSGYRIRNYFQFSVKRIARLEPPYFATLAGIFLLSAIAQLSPYSTAERLEIFEPNTFYHLLYLVDFSDHNWLSPVFWTLSIEFQFYILIGLLYPLLASKSHITQALLFFSFCAIPFILSDDRLIFNYLLMFLPGILLFRFMTAEINRNILLSFGLVLLAVSYVKFGAEGPISAFIAISFILLIKKPWKPLVFLGTISYSLYLIHTPFGTDGLINFLQNFVTSESGKIWLMLLSLPIVILAAWFFYLLVEKPSKKLSKRMEYK